GLGPGLPGFPPQRTRRADAQPLAGAPAGAYPLDRSLAPLRKRTGAAAGGAGRRPRRSLRRLSPGPVAGPSQAGLRPAPRAPPAPGRRDALPGLTTPGPTAAPRP